MLNICHSVTSGVMSPERMIECICRDWNCVRYEKQIEIEYIYEQLSAPAMPDDTNPLYEGDETGKIPSQVNEDE